MKRQPASVEYSPPVRKGGTHRTPTVIVALLAWAAFGMVLYQVVAHGPLTAIDAAAMTWSASQRNAAWIVAAEWVSSTGGPSITSIYAGFLILIALARREFAKAVSLAFLVYGAVALNVLVKDSIRRGRPVMEDPLVHLVTYSFPSGHAAASTVFGGLLIMLATAHYTEASKRVAATAAIASWVTMVCASRVYLGAHYPTDVMGGFLEGVGWVLLCRIAAHRIFPARSASRAG